MLHILLTFLWWSCTVVIDTNVFYWQCWLNNSGVKTPKLFYSTISLDTADTVFVSRCLLLLFWSYSCAGGRGWKFCVWIFSDGWKWRTNKLLTMLIQYELIIEYSSVCWAHYLLCKTRQTASQCYDIIVNNLWVKKTSKLSQVIRFKLM